ncbi:MAG: flippase-like domain-containing protein [Bryobacterales bacterium]|nr:flippase-like domain-containing protein [Bryobacterales bacterium]
MIWVYWGFDWKHDLPKLGAIHWGWVSFAIASDVGAYFIGGWRWSLLLRPVAPAGFLRSTQAIFVGLFTNSILPFRPGELLRGYLQARWLEIPYSVCLASVAVERILDGVLLVLGFYAVTLFVQVPGYLRDGSLALAVLVGILAVLLGIVMFHKHHAHAAVARSRWAAMLWHVVEGLHEMGNSRTFPAAVGASALYLAVQVLPIYALARGLKLDLPFGALAVVLMVLRIGTVLPQAPGNVGGFQFFTVVALHLFHVDKGVAAGFATLLFLVVTVPLLVGGAVAVALTGLRIRDLQHHARAGLTRSV